MHIDHNSPIQAGFWALPDRLLERHSHADRSIDQFAFSLCEKTGQFCQENERKKKRSVFKVKKSVLPFYLLGKDDSLSVWETGF